MKRREFTAGFIQARTGRGSNRLVGAAGCADGKAWEVISGRGL